MTINKKLLLLVSLLLVTVILVGGVGFFAVRTVGSKIYYLTRESSPLQIKMINLQQGFEKLAACFTQMALASSTTELSRIRGKTEAAISEIDTTARELSKLKADVDEKIFADIKKSYQELNQMAEERLASLDRLASMNQLTAANGQLQSGIGMVTEELHKLDATMHNLQKECYGTIEKAKQANVKANDQIKQLLVVKEKLANISGLIMQTSIVDNRFRLTPLKDKMKAELDAIARANLSTAIMAQLKEFVDKTQKDYSGETGLLAIRGEVLNDPQDKAAKDRYEEKRRELTRPIEALSATVVMEIDNLELILPQENTRMSQAVSMVTLVGEVANACGDITTEAHCIDSVSRKIMLASSPTEIDQLKTQVESQFKVVTATLSQIKKDLNALKRQDNFTAVRNVEAAFGGMRDVLLGENGIAATVAKNMSTQARSIQIFDEAKKLIQQFAETGAEKTRTAEAGQEKAVQVVEKVMAFTTTILILAGLTAIALGILVGGWATRSINTQLKQVIAGLSASSAQVAAAADEVSGSSQELAQGASEQAAALQQTTASMEEMASMTRQNTENAQQANLLMHESEQVVQKANNSMTEMGSSMQKITAAGDEISKIIKTIDNIAFQTNLLALNAAVEAARAGDAGMGFAVVANEVRNLALRAAEAAKNTSELVGDVTTKIAEGATLVQSTEADFREVAVSAKKVAGLVAEIAAASSEQRQGIDQTSITLGKMDQVVQKNAANAEETAAASEELNAQAKTLQEYVEQLASLIGGNSGSNQDNMVSKFRHSIAHQHEE